MILYADGCSMVYGTEIAHVPNDPFTCADDPYREKVAMPGVLGDLLCATQVINNSAPGSANDGIVRRTISKVSSLLKSGVDSKDLFVVIGFTEISRREFFDPKYHSYETFMVHARPHAKKHSQALWDQIMLNWTSEYEWVIRYIQQVTLLETFLKFHKIPYLFTNSTTGPSQKIVDLVEDLKNSHDMSACMEMINKQRYYGWNDETKTMNAYTGFHKLPRGPYHHPLEEGHKGWAHTLFDYIQANDSTVYK